MRLSPRHHLFRLVPVITCLAGVLAAQTFPDLYLLSGTPGYEGRLPVTLLRGNTESGTFKEVQVLGESSDSVLTDYDHRQIVIASPALRPTDFTVLRMDDIARSTTIRLSYKTQQEIPTGIYLLAPPKRGELLAVALGSGFDTQHQITSVKLSVVSMEDTSAPWFEKPIEDLRYLHLDGRIGGGLRDSRHDLWVAGDPLSLHVIGGEVSLGIPRPPFLSTKPIRTGGPLLINNESISVVVGAVRTLDVFNKATQEWHAIAIPFRSYRAQAFGPWIGAITEDLGSLAGIPASQVNLNNHQARMNEFRALNPGAAKRQTEVLLAAAGRHEAMTVDGFFQGDTAVYPGKLLVVNALTGFMATIETRQADSEILLINDKAVFYRVNDEIFRCGIRGGGLEEAQKLASGSQFFQVHWAFLAASKGI